MGNGRFFSISERIKDLLDQVEEIGKEIVETIKHRTKLRTVFDFFTEKVIPTFVSERDLKEYYEKRMEEVNNFIDKL